MVSKYLKWNTAWTKIFILVDFSVSKSCTGLIKIDFLIFFTSKDWHFSRELNNNEQ